jgi:hypothetical protein
MANTIRQTISLIRPQLEVVREEATRLGVTPAELIRRVLDDWRLAKAAPARPA